MSPQPKFSWLCLVAVCLSWPMNLRSQKATAELVGTVRDPAGAVLVGAIVKLTDVDTGFTRSVATNGEGTYTLSSIPAGRHTLEVELAGFKRKRIEGIVLQVNQRTRMDISMDIGEISQTVEVKEAAPIVDTETPTIGSVTTEKAIKQLPLNGRDFTQLIGLAPGVAAGTAIGVGIPKAANRINLDGGNDIEPFTGQTSITPVLDTLQEFKVQVGQYSAEYGLSGSVIVDAITKSGTNEIHGSLWEFHRNKALDAPPFFSATQGTEKIKPPLIRNQYGFLIGGPIRKNRTFFLGAYEGLKLPGSQTFVGHLPTSAEKNGDFSDYAALFNKTIIDPVTKTPFPNNVIPSNRIDPISKRVVDVLFVEPNNAGNPTRNWIQAQSDNTDQYNWSVRVDHLLTEHHNLFGRFSLQDQSRNRVGQNSIGMPLKYGDVITNYRGVHAILGATSSFSPTVVNTLAISYNRSFNRSGGPADALEAFGGCLGLGIKEPQCRPNTPFGGLPSLRIDKTNFRGAGATLDLGSSVPTFAVGQTYQLQNNLTWVKGQHTLKFGMDIQRHLAQNYNDVWPGTRFEAGYSGDGFTDLLLGIPNVVSGRLDIPTTNDLYNMYYAGYAQDDWKVSSNFTLNMGLRYEVATPIVEIHGFPGQFDPLLGTGRPYERQKGDCPTNPRACGGILYPKQNVAAIDFYSRIRPDIPYGIMDDTDSIFDTDRNNFAPRFGFAWRPFDNTKTVVRAGYGINYYFKPLLNFARFIGQIPPNDVRASLTADPTIPQFTWDTLSQNILSGVNLAQAYETNTAVGRENLNPYIQQWSLSLAREVSPNTVIEAQYVGSKSTHTQISIDLELAPFGSGAPATRVPFSKFAQLAGYYYGGFGNYNGGIFSFKRTVATGLTFSAGYTYSKAMGGGGGYAQEGDGNALQNPNARQAYKYRSGDDITHSFNSFFVWDLPFGHGRRFGSSTGGVLGHLIGGWQMSNIFIARSGFPIFMQVNRAFCNNTTGFAIRCFPNRLGTEADVESLGNGVDSPKYLRSNFPVSDNSFGNSGQNVLTQNGLWNVDWALNKITNINERFRVEFRFEAFNVFNHPTFASGISGNSGTDNFGRTVTAGEPRRLQLGLKLHF